MLLAIERVGHHEAFDLLVRAGFFADVAVPVDAAGVGAAFDGSNLVATARTEDGRLVGVCRALTDFARQCFVATLAVDPEMGGHGIGRALMARVHEAAGGADRIVLFVHAAPASFGFYERLGMTRDSDFFRLDATRSTGTPGGRSTGP